MQPNRRILVVDDNPAIHEDMRKVLGAAPSENRRLLEKEALLFDRKKQEPVFAQFELDYALQGQEALVKVETAQATGQPYALAFVDVRMPPGWDGVETIEHLWKVSPDLQTVVCTAYSDYSWETLIRRLGESDGLLILKKPFDNIEVIQLAHALTRKWQVSRQASLKAQDLDRLVTLRTAELKEANRRLKQEIEERTRMEHQLLQAQRLESVGYLAGGLAHEFNNLHTVIQGYAHLGLQETQPEHPTIKEAFDEILGASARAVNLTSELLAFSRRLMIQPRDVDVNALVSRLEPALKKICGSKGILELELTPLLPPVWADSQAMERVVSSLTSNAVEAEPDGGRITWSTRLAPPGAHELTVKPHSPEKRYVCIEMKDSNPTLKLPAADHVFDPFFGWTDHTQGSGLRLASVYGLVKQHEGWIEVAKASPQGIVFRIYWPVAALDSRAPASSERLRGPLKPDEQK